VKRFKTRTKAEDFVSSLVTLGQPPLPNPSASKSITIPYVPQVKSRDRLGAGGESHMPEGKGNKHHKNQRHHHHHPMHQDVNALGALLQF